MPILIIFGVACAILALAPLAMIVWANKTTPPRKRDHE